MRRGGVLVVVQMPLQHSPSAVQGIGRSREEFGMHIGVVEVEVVLVEVVVVGVVVDAVVAVQAWNGARSCIGASARLRELEEVERRLAALEEAPGA